MHLNWNPTSISTCLADKYLTPIADRLWRVQEKLSRHVQPNEGDDSWVAGCTAYKRRCFALEHMQLEEEFRPWLWAGSVDGHFTIKLDGFPVRIFRTPAEGEIPDRYVERSQMELALLGSALGTPSNEVPDYLYRIEVVSTGFGKPVSIALVEVNSAGEVTNTYTIPRSAPVKASVSIEPIRKRKPPVVPQETQVGPTREKGPAPLTIIRQGNPA